MDAERLKDLHERLQHLRSQREEWDEHWKDIRDYLMPFKGRFIGDGEKPGEDISRMGEIVDSTASRSVRVLVSGLHSGLTPPSRPWFRLGLYNDELEKQTQVKLWLGEVQRRVLGAMQGSNFYNVIHNGYEELPTFGTAAMLAMPHPDRKIHCYPMTVGEYYLQANEFGVIDTLYRWFWMTARAAEQKFGRDNLSDHARRKLESKPYDYIEIIHMIQPATKQSKTMLGWESVCYEPCAVPDKVLSESGFEEQAFAAPRWEVSGSEVYGWSPGALTLPDIKTLQQLNRDRLKATAKMIDPPVRVPRSYKENLRTMPGGITYVDAQNNDMIGPLYQINPDISAVSLSIEDVRAAIRDGFFNDLFLMMAMQDNRTRQPVTAREVAERHEEKLIMLGPVIERLQNELLRPLIDRVFAIMMRGGHLPQPPRELEGVDLRIEYISLLAQAQKMVGTQTLESIATFTGAVAQYKPEALDKLDVDELIDQYADLTGVPADIILADDVVAGIRQARQQQMQQQQMMENAGQLAQGAKVLSDTATDRRNALTDMLGVG